VQCPSPKARVRAAAATVAALIGAVACGRPATREDCELIIDKNVELEMKQMKIADQVAIDKRKAEIRASMEGQLKGCIGKRVTDGMMKCVRNANTTDAIDACMR
jgi:hypothetical protein